MPAAGTVGFGDRYRALLDYEKLGALVTNPTTIDPWRPATGTRIISLDAGVLVHTGLPNPGLAKVISQYRRTWASLPIPVIVHLVGTSLSQMKQAVSLIDDADEIAAVEFGLGDDIDESDAVDLVTEASRMEKPLLARLPFYECQQLALPDRRSRGRRAGVDGAAARNRSRPEYGAARQRACVWSADETD